MMLIGVSGGGRNLSGGENVREDKVAEDKVGAVGDVVQRLGVGR